MRNVLIVVGVVVALLIVLVPVLFLFLSGRPPSGAYDAWLPAVRDVALIYSSLFLCIGAILFIFMTAAITFLAFTIRDHVVPALNKLDDTARTVKGTTTFVSESVVSPIIKVAGASAGARAMVQTLMRRNPPKNDKNGKKDQG